MTFTLIVTVSQTHTHPRTCNIVQFVPSKPFSCTRVLINFSNWILIKSDVGEVSLEDSEDEDEEVIGGQSTDTTEEGADSDSSSDDTESEFRLDHAVGRKSAAAHAAAFDAVKRVDRLLSSVGSQSRTRFRRFKSSNLQYVFDNETLFCFELEQVGNMSKGPGNTASAGMKEQSAKVATSADQISRKDIKERDIPAEDSGVKSKVERFESSAGGSVQEKDSKPADQTIPGSTVKEKVGREDSAKDRKPDKNTATEMTMANVEFLLGKLESLLGEVTQQHATIEELTLANQNLKEKTDLATSHKVKMLESQNALLREKSLESRKENDILVEKIQRLHSKISFEVRTSVSCTDEGEAEDPFYTTKSSAVHSPEVKDKREFVYERSKSCSAESGNISCSVHQEIIKNQEKQIEDSVEKMMRLEQRIVCLQNANNMNSCATCRPLRKHVIKIERQLLSLVQERKSQIEELFQLKQMALSSAVSEKDAHLAWLEVTGEGNVYTMNSVEKLRKERREILNKMKEENENRLRLIVKLEEAPALFTGTAKLSAISALGDTFVSDSEYDEDSLGFQSTCSLQSTSTGEMVDVHTNPVLFLSTSPSNEDEVSYPSFFPTSSFRGSAAHSTSIPDMTQWREEGNQQQLYREESKGSSTDTVVHTEQQSGSPLLLTTNQHVKQPMKTCFAHAADPIVTTAARTSEQPLACSQHTTDEH